MKDREDKRPESEGYRFMNETIKKRPVDRRRLAGIILGITAAGLLFGVCAAFTFTAVFPTAAQRLGLMPAQQDIHLSENAPLPSATEIPSETDTLPEAEPLQAEDSDTFSSSGGQVREEILAAQNPLEIYEEIYEDVLKVAEEPRKALVRVSGISEDSDLLDQSFLSYGNEEGIVFLENETDLYILTTYQEKKDAELFRVTFSNGAVATGNLCKLDIRTGLAVLRVPLNSISEKTRQETAVAVLSESYSLQKAKTVIAIGSPAGDYDGVDYGTVTSVTGKLVVADGEYSLLSTNLHGSQEGGGVLLDTAGEIIGLIIHTDKENANILKAVSIAHLRPLIEILSNGENIRYTGIRGATISDEQASGLDIPKGIYVDSVDSDSPAMAAGIQNGDIVHALNGAEVKSVQGYAAQLQKLNGGNRAVISLYRRDGAGEFVDMDLKVTIEER